MLHLLGDKEFPEELFLKTDEALCEVHYETYTNQLEMTRNEYVKRAEQYGKEYEQVEF